MTPTKPPVFPEYPPAHWVPLPNDHFVLGPFSKDLIVCHITQGPSASSAINTFLASKAPPVGSGRTSVQFVIDRDGTTYQLTPIHAQAWHASACNTRSVGIEHAAIAGTMGITPEQIQASIKLIAWLCKKLSLPIDSAHIMSHNEASPRDLHVHCCEPTLMVAELIAGAKGIGE